VDVEVVGRLLATLPEDDDHPFDGDGMVHVVGFRDGNAF
jgi:carotenoid cleavage dioxygenase-like enzyme